MKQHFLPKKLSKLAVPKLNREIELTSGYQNNDQFVNSKEKALYSSQNYLTKAMGIIATMSDDILKSAENTSIMDHKDMLQKCIQSITLLGHVQAEYTSKRKNNVRNIVSSEYTALCGPKPGSKEALKRPRNDTSTYLLGDNLKTEAKLAKAVSDMFRGSSSNNAKRPR